MMTRYWKGFRAGRVAAIAGLCLFLAESACNTDKVTIPGLSGPSELGLSLKLDASPDLLTADGVSTSAIQATLHDQNGNPRSGQAVNFIITDASGVPVSLGVLNRDTAVTGPDGTATVFYRAPVRTDFTANGSVLILARPIGTDANAAVFREVRIELRSAEGRLFSGGGSSPGCSFIIEAPDGFLVGRSILFQTTSTGTIVRYFWDFGDDSPSEDTPDTNHVYRIAGTFTVTHIVTGDGGIQASCTLPVTIN